MPPRALSLAVRLWFTAGMAFLGSIALLAVAWRTIDEVKVRGALYQDIVSYKDLLADILPPPAYLIESYLTCFELIKAQGQEQEELLKKLTSLEKDYNDRISVWDKELKLQHLRQSMLTDAAQPAQAFFATLKQDFIPAVRRGESDKANAILMGPLTQAYRQHRSGIDKTVESSNKEVLIVEAKADAALSHSTRILLGAAVGINILVLALTYLSIRSIMRPISTLMDYARRVSKGDYDCSCEVRTSNEIGNLASVLSETVVKVKASIEQASGAEHLAQREAENARVATARAEEAKSKAELAKQQGMHQAAMRLEKVVEFLGVASEQLAAQIKQSSTGAKTQASKAAEVASAMEQMNTTVGQVASHANRTAETSAQAQAKANLGAEVVKQVVLGIGAVQNTAVSLKKEMTDLGRQSDGIGQILGVISDIADQTNLLALNAAIEAARAGDAGRGFAVVADEVRKLAEKTMVATKQVGEAIKGVQTSTLTNISKVEEAVEAIRGATNLAGRSGEALTDIVHLVGAAYDQVHAIAVAADQQSAASSEINKAVDEVHAVAKESSVVMDAAAMAVVELSRQAGDLRSLIQDLKSDDAAAVA